MLRVLRLQAILVKSPMRLSNSAFPVVDIVGDGIWESKEAGEPLQTSCSSVPPVFNAHFISLSHTLTVRWR